MGKPAHSAGSSPHAAQPLENYIVVRELRSLDLHELSNDCGISIRRLKALRAGAEPSAFERAIINVYVATGAKSRVGEAEEAA